MLAHKLKQVENMHFKPAVSDSEGTPHTDNTSINLAFKQFYSNLYTSEYMQRIKILTHSLMGWISQLLVSVIMQRWSLLSLSQKLSKQSAN